MVVGLKFKSCWLNIRGRIKIFTGKHPLKVRVAGILLMAGGLVALAIAGYQWWFQADYHQNKFRDSYEASKDEAPDDKKPDDNADLYETVDHVVITEQEPMRLIIPAIDVDLIVQYGNVYDMSLQDRGPVHYGKTTHPDTGEKILESPLPSTEPGNVVISAHRGARWGFFTDLDLLKEGDEIYLDISGYRFIYLLEWIKIVEEDDWSLLHSPGYPALTLQTCEPKHSSATHRLIARAALSAVYRSKVE